MDSLFSSTLDIVAHLRLRKIKEKSPTPWYNEHTCALKRAAHKIEHSWRKTRDILYYLAGKYPILQKIIKNCKIWIPFSEEKKITPGIYSMQWQN